jgi:hypothetical protein
MPGARCTRGLVCKIVRRNAHEHTGSAETLRHSPRNGFTAYSALSSVTGFLATVIGGIPRSIHLDRCATANLAPASGRQNHTTSPSASATLVSRSLRVHRISPHVRDDREPPLSSGETGQFLALICPTEQSSTVHPCFRTAVKNIATVKAIIELWEASPIDANLGSVAMRFALVRIYERAR